MLLVDATDCESCQIILAFGVESGHLRRLPSDQGTSGPVTSFGDASDDLFDLIRADLARGEIVQEKQGLSSLADDVVYALGYQVDAYRIVAIGHEGHLQFGSHAVSA